MISGWEGFAWAIIGFLSGIIISNPKKFYKYGGDGMSKETAKNLIKASNAFLGSKKATPKRK